MVTMLSTNSAKFQSEEDITNVNSASNSTADAPARESGLASPTSDRLV